MGGSGAQASLQTHSKVHSGSGGDMEKIMEALGGEKTPSFKSTGGSDDSMKSAARKALEALDGGSSPSSAAFLPQGKLTSEPSIAHGNDMQSLAKQALRIMDGGSSQGPRSVGMPASERYQGDDVANLARQAIRQMEGGFAEPAPQPKASSSNDMTSLAKDALKALDGVAEPKAPEPAP